jgi:transglutaminase-like putative cysteine protease
MKFKIGCELDYKVLADSTFIFNIRAVENEQQQVIQQDLYLAPELDYQDYQDPSLVNSYFRLMALKGNLKLTYQATVELTPPSNNLSEATEILPAAIPLDVVPYLYPSRYCQSDRLMRLAQDEFGDCQPGYVRVQAICDWIYVKVAYISGSTDSHTSAYDTVTERAGVCRDFAHLGIAFCRALDIPARFVSAYAWQLQPPDFHACFEAYLGNQWHLFDATRLAPTDSLIRIGTGRDAVDVAFATFFGSAQLCNMNVYSERIDN